MRKRKESYSEILDRQSQIDSTNVQISLLKAEREAYLKKGEQKDQIQQGVALGLAMSFVAMLIYFFLGN